MDQHNRPEANQNAQNVHLHMHHMCNCPPGIFPTTFYPAVGFRAPMPSLMPYHTQSVARPYMQHYQYTQFNVGSHYTLPIGHMTGSSTTVQYGPSSSGSSDLVYGGATIKEKREEGNGDTDRTTISAAADPPLQPPPPEGYETGEITPPDNELQVADFTSEEFVKFLERRCVTAEQIAYRNRNRPCFRNIQNLCIRTRSEILKPCTTISNIHSQGIPWATKDFIYAFVRLVNCWHIMRGYWDNRDGCGLGKIDKGLTPEFRDCYLEWERKTKEMSNHLSNMFYDMDVNLNVSSSGPNNAFNIPSQVNLTKSSSDGTLTNHQLPYTGSSSASTPTNSSKSTAKDPRNNLPVASVTETVDQANQTVPDYDAEDHRYIFGHYPDEYQVFNPNRVYYMKPGNYNVPRKGSDASSVTRGIEFLETAQNIHKAKEVWASFSRVKKEEVKKPEVEDVGLMDLPDTNHLNVHEWLINHNFSEHGDNKPQNAPQQEMKSFYMDSLYDSLPVMDPDGPSGAPPVTLLQRGKSTLPLPLPIKTGRKVRRGGGSGNSNPYEFLAGGITETGRFILERLIKSLKGHVLGPSGEGDLDKILRKMAHHEYHLVNEVVRDLKYFTKMWDDIDLHHAGWFALKLSFLLAEHFGGYDFEHIRGDPKEKVGPLRPGIYINDCDQFI